MVVTSESYIASMTEEIAIEIERRIKLEESDEVEPPPGDAVMIEPRSAGGEQISVASWSFNVHANAKKHHTDKFGLLKDNPPIPVLRRGSPFTIDLTFTRDVDKANDNIYLVFSFGPSPDFAKGTQVKVPLQGSAPLGVSYDWQARYEKEDGPNVTIEVASPANALVGEWKFKIETVRADDPSERKLTTSEQKLYILFNPWSPYDGTYMNSDELLEEYVLNDCGKVWCGVHDAYGGNPWRFGQFDASILPVVILLLNKTELPHNKWGSPILITRALSEACNNTKGGLLEGNWSNNYAGGMKPTDWTGSAAIFETYARNGGSPVKFGQCWVFSACATTACRALGIPARSLTNFSSAHDTNRNLCVDKYMTANGLQMPGGPRGDSNDSVWNFHVWTDAWMARPDLPVGYSGWQAFDATPQEASSHSGSYECGPAPLAAIKNGEVGVSYDTPFIFAEVNADIVNYVQDAGHPLGYKRASSDKKGIGLSIVTKKPNKYDPYGISDAEEITEEYKYPEGSAQERQALERAYQCLNISSPAMAPAPFPEYITFKLTDNGKVSIGEEVKVSLNVKNTWDKTLTLDIHLVANSALYNGKIVSEIKHEHETVNVEASKSDTLQMVLPPSLYMGKLSDMGLIKVTCLAVVKETEQMWSGGVDINLQKPVLTIQIQGGLKVREMAQAQLSFKNPLDIALTECQFSMEGSGLRKPNLIPYGDVEPNSTAKHTVEFKPRIAGKTTYIASFSSKQLVGINGSIIVDIKE